MYIYIYKLLKLANTFYKLSTTQNWYHGSPTLGFTSASEIKGNLFFITESFQIAKEYATHAMLYGAQKITNDDPVIPTVYTIGLSFPLSVDFYEEFKHKRDEAL